MSNIPLIERTKWLGASESAALFGLSPYVTEFELWHIKSGSVPQHNLDGMERVEAGQYLEPAIAAWASHKWEWPLQKVPEYIVNPTVAQMGASLDFETADGEPVEIKNVDSLIFRDSWQVEGDVIADAPGHFLIQVQHQLSCRPDAARGWLVACVGGNRLYRMEIPRHNKLIARIENAVLRFWSSVHDRREPKPNFEMDSETISLLYNSGSGDVDLRNNNRLPELCAAVIEQKAIQKAAEARVDASLAEIKTIVGRSSKALAAGGYVISATNIAEITVPATTKRAHRRWTVKHEEKIHG